MLRTILSVIAGVAAWIVLVIAADFAMSHFWPAYQLAKPAMAFTLPMLIGRLTESTIALIIAAFVTTKIAPSSRAAPWALGIVLLAAFIPIHIGIWSKFPIWYHLTFLSSLVVVSVIAGSLMQTKTPPTTPA